MPKDGKEVAHHNSYEFFFDQLGITEKETRDELKKRARAFKNAPQRRDLPHSGTAEDMRQAVDKFVQLWGPVYWGEATHTKLEYPRDRESLGRIIHAMFTFQASMRHIGQKGMSRRWGNNAASTHQSEPQPDEDRFKLSSRYASQAALPSRASPSIHSFPQGHDADLLPDPRLVDLVRPNLASRSSAPTSRIAPSRTINHSRESLRPPARRDPALPNVEGESAKPSLSMTSSDTPEAHHYIYSDESGIFGTDPNDNTSGFHYDFANRHQNSIAGGSHTLAFLPRIALSQDAVHGSNEDIFRGIEDEITLNIGRRNSYPIPSTPGPLTPRATAAHQSQTAALANDLHSARFPSPPAGFVKQESTPDRGRDVVDLISESDHISSPPRKIKRETSYLDPTILANTHLSVSVTINSHPTTPYPTRIPLEDVYSTRHAQTVPLFPRVLTALIEDEDLTEEQARRVKSAGVTYGWNGKKMRLRRGNAADWNYFCRELEAGWARRNELKTEHFEVALEVLVLEGSTLGRR